MLSSYQDEGIYKKTLRLLSSYQNELKRDNTQANEVLFNYYYGGSGNHVLINKNISLEVIDNHFLYKKGNKEYHIESSVHGVFREASYAMQYPAEIVAWITEAVVDDDKPKITVWDRIKELFIK